MQSLIFLKNVSTLSAEGKGAWGPADSPVVLHPPSCLRPDLSHDTRRKARTSQVQNDAPPGKPATTEGRPQTHGTQDGRRAGKRGAQKRDSRARACDADRGGFQTEARTHRLGTRRAKSASSRHHARLPARRGTALDQAKGVSSTGDCKPVAASRSASESLFSFQKKKKKT